MGRCRPLSDTNLSTKWDILTNEARKVLKLGKKIGLQIEGNEEDVVKELAVDRDVYPEEVLDPEMRFDAGLVCSKGSGKCSFCSLVGNAFSSWYVKGE
ncbi:hypothetical protein V6N13_064974 [Hibiscus sabdariffa]